MPAMASETTGIVAQPIAVVHNGSGKVVLDVIAVGTAAETLRGDVVRELIARGYEVIDSRGDDSPAFWIRGLIDTRGGWLVVLDELRHEPVRAIEFAVHRDDLVLPIVLPREVAQTLVDAQYPPPPAPTGTALVCLIEPADCPHYVPTECLDDVARGP
jgi:hypothetical protein